MVETMALGDNARNQQKSRRRLIWFFALLVIGSLALYGYAILLANLESLPCRPVGSISEESLRVGFMAGFFLSILYCLIAISAIFFVPYTLTKKRFRRWQLLLAMILSVEALVFIRTVDGRRWWENTSIAVSQVPARAQPLIEAIERFKQARGEYPNNLKELQPDFILEIPHTNMAGYPTFSYEHATTDTAFKTYELAIGMGLPLQFDRLIY